MSHRRISVIVLCIVFAGGTGSNVLADDVSSPITAPIRWRNAEQALEISRLSAENGMQDLSLRALRTALNGGTPVGITRVRVESGKSGGSEGAIFSSGIRIGDIASKRFDRQASIEVAVEALQRRIDAIWKEQEFESTAVYETLADIVLPNHQPDAAYLYCTANSGPSRRYPDSIGLRLMEWARRADMQDDLLQRVKLRTHKSGTSFAAAFYAAHVHLEFGAMEDFGKSAKHLLGVAVRGYPAHYNEHVLCLAFKAIEAGGTQKCCTDLLNMALDQIVSAAAGPSAESSMSDGQMEPVSSLLLTAAKWSFIADRNDDGLRRLEQYLKFNATQNERHSEEYGRQLRRFQLQNVAGVLLRQGLVTQAFDKYGEAALLSSGNNSSLNSGSIATLLAYLTQLPTQERYDLLRRVCLPSDGTVSLLTTVLPAESPPPEFLIGSSEGLTTAATGLSPAFDTSSVVLGTGLLLIDAAAELGQLTVLRDHLESRPMISGDTNILYALTLCRMNEAEAAVPVVNKIAESIGYDARTRQNNRCPLNPLVVFFEASQHSVANSAAETLAVELSTYIKRCSVPQAQQALTTLQFQRNTTERTSDIMLPRHWCSSASVANRQQSVGAVSSLWSVDKEIITHHAGPGRDSLHLSFPLAGTFELSGEVTTGSGNEAGVGYGGLYLKSSLKRSRSSVHATSQHDWESEPREFSGETEFRPFTVEVSDEGTSYSSGKEPVYTDKHCSHRTPWIQLTADSEHNASWRALRISGSVQIPRTVDLSGSFCLRGWTTNPFEESHPAVVPAEPKKTGVPSRQTDWSCRDNTITGPRHRSRNVKAGPLAAEAADVLLNQPAHSLLQYDRPLNSGEFVSWEFKYKPGQVLVSPAVGRLVFLLRPEGIALRYLISEQNWFGLASGNAIEVESERRGGGSFSLQPGWNKAKLAIAKDLVTLSLNGDVVYERRLRETDSRQFGFYHNSRTHKAVARNVVLSGDWPTQVPADILSNLAKPVK